VLSTHTQNIPTPNRQFPGVISHSTPEKVYSSKLAQSISSSHSSSGNKRVRLKTKYSFISLFNPSVIYSARLVLSHSLTEQKCSKLKKVLVKQSYMFLVWLKKISSASNSGLIVFPKNTKSHSTKLKAPMAHKTFSQEQFTFRYFKFTFSSRILSPRQQIFTGNSLQSSILVPLLLLLKIRGLPLDHETLFFFNSRAFVNTQVSLRSYVHVN
jgi:hypothetical protein